MVKIINSGIDNVLGVKAMANNIWQNTPALRKQHTLMGVGGWVRNAVNVVRFIRWQNSNTNEAFVVKRYEEFERDRLASLRSPACRGDWESDEESPTETDSSSSSAESSSSSDDGEVEDVTPAPKLTAPKLTVHKLPAPKLKIPKLPAPQLPAEQPVMVQPSRVKDPPSDEALLKRLDEDLHRVCKNLMRHRDRLPIESAVKEVVPKLWDRLFVAIAHYDSATLRRVHSAKFYGMLGRTARWEPSLIFFQAVCKTWLAVLATVGMECPVDQQQARAYQELVRSKTTWFSNTLVKLYRDDPKAVYGAIRCANQCVDEFFKAASNGERWHIDQELTNMVFMHSRNAIEHAGWNFDRMIQYRQFAETFQMTMNWVVGVYWDSPDPAWAKEYQTAKDALNAALNDLFAQPRDDSREAARTQHSDDRRVDYADDRRWRPRVVVQSNSSGYRRRDEAHDIGRGRRDVDHDIGRRRRDRSREPRSPICIRY